MKNLVMVFVAALAVLLLVPPVHAQGWTLSGNPVFTADPTAPGGGPNPAQNGGSNTVSNTQANLSSTSTAVSSPNAYVHQSASVYGSYRQNFFWQGYGPPDTRFNVYASYNVDGEITAQGYDRASSYAAPSHGGASGDTGAPGANTFYGISTGFTYTAFANPPGSFTASTTATYGVQTDAGNPPNGTVQPTQRSNAYASGSYTIGNGP